MAALLHYRYYFSTNHGLFVRGWSRWPKYFAAGKANFRRAARKKMKNIKMKRFSYFRYKLMRAKLAGFFKVFPIALLIISSGICLIAVCQQNVTPASVSVSGYTRSNGVKVSSYSRRPPGAVSHDTPYSFVGFLGFLFFCAGATGCIYVIYRYKKENDFDLLPSIQIELPAKPRQQITVPNKHVRARDTWECLRCEEKINSGEYYWLYEIKYKGLYRYCAVCKEKLETEYKEIEMEMTKYKLKIEELNRTVKTRYYESYKQYYKVTPEEFGDSNELHIYNNSLLS